MPILDALYDYLIEPIKTGSGYNPVNTLVLAVLFYILVVTMFSALNFLKFRIEDFPKTFLPYILLGGLMRSLEDAGVYPATFPERAFFVTPGVYLVVSFFFFLAVILSKKMKLDFTQEFGWFLVAVNLTMLKPINSSVVAATVALTLLVLGILWLVFRSFNFKLMLEPLNLAVLAAHLFEASATFIGVDFFNYSEQHVVATGLINFSGSAFSVILLKAAVLPLLLWLCGSFDEKEQIFIKTMILALGLGPGLRDVTSVAMGV